jgi:two-component system response regulator TctD
LYQVGLVQPDLVVLDIKGWETLRRMRARSSVPIIVLIEDELGDRIESLNQGADYFVTKPPSLREVEAKARALLRRRTPMQPPMRVQSSTVEEVTGPRQAGVCEIGP